MRGLVTSHPECDAEDDSEHMCPLSSHRPWPVRLTCYRSAERLALNLVVLLLGDRAR